MNILIVGIVESVTLHATKDINHTLYGCYLMLRIFKFKLHRRKLYGLDKFFIYQLVNINL